MASAAAVLAAAEAEALDGGGEGGRASEGTKPLQRLLSHEDLLGLRNAFLQAAREAADAAGCDDPEAYSLTEREFVAALLPVFGSQGVSEMDLRVLFMRIDANANGSVDWREVSSFLLLNKTREKLQVESCRRFEESYAGGHSDLRAVVHKSIVCRVLIHPRLSNYFSASEDGVVKMWNCQTLAHERTVHNGDVWVSDLCYMPAGSTASDHVVVSSVDRVISVYTPAGDLVRTFRGRKLRARDLRREHMRRYDFIAPGGGDGVAVEGEGGAGAGLLPDPNSATYMSHFQKPRDLEVIRLDNLVEPPTALAHCPAEERDRLFIASGTAVMLYDIPLGALDDSTIGIPCLNNSLFQQQGGAGRGRGKPGWDSGHEEAITRIAVSTEIESVITSSHDSTLRILNLERGTQLRTLGVARPLNLDVELFGTVAAARAHSSVGAGADDGAELGHRKGINNFAWNESVSLIASCGQERDCVLWNPFIPKPTNRLRVDTIPGRATPLVDVCFALPEAAEYGQSGAQVLTLSMDKVVRVWDLRTMRCVQSLRDKSCYTPEDRLGVIAFDEKRQCIITASTIMHARFGQAESGPAVGAPQEPQQGEMVAVVVSSLYKQVVSCDVHHVMVWDADSLRLIVTWAVPEGITSAVLDHTERRLLTGTTTGSVLVWNYSNAYLLKVCEPDVMRDAEGRRTKSAVAPGEVSALLYELQEKPNRARVVVTCQSQSRILLYEDAEGVNSEPYYRQIELGDAAQGRGKGRQIFSACFIPPSLLLLGISNGLAGVFLDQVARPAPLPSHPLGELYQGVFDGPLHHTAEASPTLLDICSGSENVDSYVECIVYLPRTRNLAACSRGDGVVSIWECCGEHGGPGGRGELIRWLAAYRCGDGIYALVADHSDTLLFTGDVHGYVHTYSIAEFSAQCADPRGIVKICGFRSPAVTGVTSLAYLRHGTEDRVLIGSACGDISLCTKEGHRICIFGRTTMVKSPPQSDGGQSASEEACLAAFRADWARDLLAERGPLPVSEVARAAEEISGELDAAASTPTDSQSDAPLPVPTVSARDKSALLQQVLTGCTAEDIAVALQRAAGHCIAPCPPPPWASAEEAKEQWYQVADEGGSGDSGTPRSRRNRQQQQGAALQLGAPSPRRPQLHSPPTVQYALQISPARASGRDRALSPARRPRTAPAAGRWQRDGAALLSPSPPAPPGTLSKWNRPKRQPAWQRAEEVRRAPLSPSAGETKWVHGQQRRRRRRRDRTRESASDGAPGARQGPPEEERPRAGPRKAKYRYPPEGRLEKTRAPPAGAPEEGAPGVALRPASRVSLSAAGLGGLLQGPWAAWQQKGMQMFGPADWVPPKDALLPEQTPLPPSPQPPPHGRVSHGAPVTPVRPESAQPSTEPSVPSAPLFWDSGRGAPRKGAVLNTEEGGPPVAVLDAPPPEIRSPHAPRRPRDAAVRKPGPKGKTTPVIATTVAAAQLLSNLGSPSSMSTPTATPHQRRDTAGALSTQPRQSTTTQLAAALPPPQRPQQGESASPRRSLLGARRVDGAAARAQEISAAEEAAAAALAGEAQRAEAAKWFERAQREYPPPRKRRHRTFNVSEVPMRAMSQLTPQPLATVAPPQAALVRRAFARSRRQKGTAAAVAAAVAAAAGALCARQQSGAAQQGHAAGVQGVQSPGRRARPQAKRSPATTATPRLSPLTGASLALRQASMVPLQSEEDGERPEGRSDAGPALGH
eukprot:TRINITY_DN8000_c0_g1_i1.p1 TRINITY_DN8000_c0_g1~~TRINITY_DN8000_c0_g1_i1.p1  ORF type:complete len:1769 (+),score=478.30 TRINITY_DN8000_c0_g1_i1:145-5307(+)